MAFNHINSQHAIAYYQTNVELIGQDRQVDRTNVCTILCTSSDRFFVYPISNLQIISAIYLFNPPYRYITFIMQWLQILLNQLYLEEARFINSNGYISKLKSFVDVFKMKIHHA